MLIITEHITRHSYRGVDFVVTTKADGSTGLLFLPTTGTRTINKLGQPFNQRQSAIKSTKSFIRRHQRQLQAAA